MRQVRQTVWVVTDAALGWDCVVGVFDNEEAAKRSAESRYGGSGYYESHSVYTSSDE